MAAPKKAPHYDLLHLQGKARRKFERAICGSAAADGRALGFSEERMWQCVESIDAKMFHKTMESTLCPGLWQDVYRVPFSGEVLYVKLQLGVNDLVVLISLRRQK